MFAITFLALWLLIRSCPDTPAAKFLRRTMVDAPASWLVQLTRGQLLVGFAVFAATAFVLWLVGSEAARMMSMAVPDAFVWLTTFEVTSYVDALAAGVIAASSIRLRELKNLLPRRLRRRRDVTRVTRARRMPRPARDKAANDDDDERSAIALAA